MIAKCLYGMAALACCCFVGCEHHECHCRPEHPVQVDHHWEKYNASLSGTVVGSDATDMLGYQFDSSWGGEPVVGIYTEEAAGAVGGVELRVQFFLPLRYYMPNQYYDFDNLYMPIDPAVVYLDDSGAEQVHFGPKGDRLSLMVTEMDGLRNLLRVDGYLTSVTGTEVVELVFDDVTWEYSECYFCYYPDGDSDGW